jgi:NNP family nitrate/nitrite transporter-like MFS transporter
MKRYSRVAGMGALLLSFLWLLWFINFTCRTILSPLMPLIEDEFLVTHARASSLFAFISAGYGISVFFSGLFAGNFGYKRSIAVSLSITTTVFFLISFTKAFSMLALACFVLGLSTGMYLPCAIPLITSHFEEKSWGKAIAIHDSAASFSIFVIPFLAMGLLKLFKWRQIFDVFGFVCAACFAIFLFTGQEIRVKSKAGDLLRDLLGRRSLWIFGAVWVFAAGANLGIYFILPLYLTKELMLDMGYANKIFGFTRLGGVFTAIAVGFIVDRFSLRKTMFFLFLATGIFTLFLALKDFTFVQIFLFLQAASSLGFFPVSLVALSRVFPIEHRSLATGIIVTLGVVFGHGVVPYLLGLAGDHLSFRFGLLVFGSLVILASTLIFRLKELG